MLKSVRMKVWRDRKRLAFVAFLAFFAGYIFYLRTDAFIGPVHISLVTGLVYALVVTLAALLVCLLLPNLRFMIEAVAISRLMLSLFVFAAPELGYRLLASPELTALVVVAGGALISRMIHGRILREQARGWRDRIVPREAFLRAPVRVRATPAQARFVHWVDDMRPLAA